MQYLHKLNLISTIFIVLEPIIGFSKTIYNVLEPKTEDSVSKVRVSVKRSGDTSKESIIRFYTKDGNAESGKDYNPVSKRK